MCVEQSVSCAHSPDYHVYVSRCIDPCACAQTHMCVTGVGVFFSAKFTALEKLKCIRRFIIRTALILFCLIIYTYIYLLMEVELG